MFDYKYEIIYNFFIINNDSLSTNLPWPELPAKSIILSMYDPEVKDNPMSKFVLDWLPKEPPLA